MFELSTQPSFARLSPGDLVWLKPNSADRANDTYGLATNPALVLRNLPPNYLAVVQLTSRSKLSSFYPPIVAKGRPFYVAIPSLRIVRVTHLSSYKLIDKLNSYALKSITGQITSFITS